MHETYNAEAMRVLSVTNTTIIQAKKSSIKTVSNDKV
jgi:hypothetical protein